LSDPPGALLFQVAPDEAGRRLDLLVVRRLSGAGRRGATELFRSGAVTVDGRPARKGDRARAGTTVRIAAALDPVMAEPAAPLTVALERDDVMVVDKPAGQPTAPLERGELGTLAGALLGRHPELLGIGHRPNEPGLLHRLDTGTSGLLVVARSAAAFERLHEGMRAGQLHKEYFAVVGAAGLEPSGTIESPLEPDPSDSRRVRVAPPEARRARESSTRYEIRSIFGPWALVNVEVSRAYRHQIRVHLASIGHPLAGDGLYGGADVPGLEGRHALHASLVRWAGDEGVAPFEVGSALPPEMQALVER